METIKIYLEDIERTTFDLRSNMVLVKRKCDPFIYFVDTDYYSNSMADRGFITVSFDY